MGGAGSCLAVWVNKRRRKNGRRLYSLNRGPACPWLIVNTYIVHSDRWPLSYPTLRHLVMEGADYV